MDDQPPTQPADTQDNGPPLLFDAVLYPHRSLSRTGFWLVMGLVSIVSFGAGTAFYRVGAWPIVGFLGLDVALIYTAFRINYRAARLTELIKLDERELRIQRISPRGKMLSWTFSSFWVRVRMDNPPDEDSDLVISSHGRYLELGAYLSPQEKLDVATALNAALSELRDGAVFPDPEPDATAP